MITVSALNIYPIKSCGGISLNRADIVDRGFRYDRRWMVTDSTGRFLTQREHPRLALAKVRMENDRFTVSADGLGTSSFDIEQVAAPAVSVEVWGDPVPALRGNPEAEDWFSTLIGMPCWLVHMPETSVRPLNHDTSSQKHHIAFSDAFPFLLLSEGSLEDLNRRMSVPLPMTRFRPNIVVQGCSAFEEDTWQTIRIGSVPFLVAKGCARCATTTVNQETGEKGQEPLRTLATFRNRDGEVFFGQNLIHLEQGTLRVGDRLVPLPLEAG